MELSAEGLDLAAVSVLPVGLFLAAAVTKLVDFLRNVVPGHLEEHKWASILLAGVIGIGLTWLANFNIFAALNIGVRSTPIALCVSGLLIAGGAGAMHELLDLMSSTAKRARPTRRD